jgi:hypothetical protein
VAHHADHPQHPRSGVQEDEDLTQFEPLNFLTQNVQPTGAVPIFKMTFHSGATGRDMERKD